jgi:hypothetical protein
LQPTWPPGNHDMNNSEFTFYHKAFMWIWPILVQWFWRRSFLNAPTPFLHFCNYLPFEEDLVIYLKKLDFPLPKVDWYQFWLKLACWFLKKRFLKCQCIFTIFYYFHLEKGVHLNNLESSPPKYDLLKLAQWFWRGCRTCKSL